MSVLTGRTAVVTGGSRGIGRAIALKLASLGANVAIVYAGRTDAAQAAVSYTHLTLPTILLV